MRRAWSSSASVTIVMRETSGFSVRPTVSESMLNARRRNSEATRVSTPGLFSTYTTNVFNIGLSRVRAGFDQRIRPANHFMQRCACRHHRVHRVLALHLEIDQDGAVVLMRHLHSGHDLRA